MFQIIDLDFTHANFDKQTVHVPSEYEKRWISPLIILAGVGAGFMTVPEAILPTPAWIIATLTGVSECTYREMGIDDNQVVKPYQCGPSPR